MRTSLCVFLLAGMAVTGCRLQPAATDQPQPLTSTRAAQVENGVRVFMQAVAHDVTQEGPMAWRKYFADSPAFFMAVDGRMVFADSAAASKGIHDAALDIKHIELVWNGDLRIDPLTPELAVVATPWHEVQVNAEGKRVDEDGFFTGVAEYRDGRWQFRNAHWSLIAPPPAAR